MLASAATVEALEFQAVLALVAREARTDLGRERLRKLQPAPTLSEFERRRGAYQTVGQLRVELPLVPSFDTPLKPLFQRLETGDPPPSGADLLQLACALEAALEAAERWQNHSAEAPSLEGDPEALKPLRIPVKRVQQLLDSRGEVRPDASPRLQQLGRELRTRRDRIYRRLRELREAYPQLGAEEVPPLAEGRLVLRLQHPDRRVVPGIVHGRSGSGKSVYFEPLELVEDNNGMARARSDYEREVERILGELRSALTAHLPSLQEAQLLLAEWDSLEAMHRFAIRARCCLAERAPDGELRLCAARHPLLDPSLAAAREAEFGQAGHTGEVVPLELDLGDSQRLLVVTGPNAGGKTVALKTVGLLALLHAAGGPIPAEASSRLPWLERLVAVVGDEQDLLAERSTFSGRLVRLREAWEAAGARSLVLLDELGSGTDPVEGGALSQALLEKFAHSGTLGLVTTHLPQLAAAALGLEGVRPAAMEFEAGLGLPTFRLQVGSPGGSEALALARRLGLDPSWVSRAEALLGSGYLELQQLLERLALEQQALLAARAAAERACAEADSARTRFERETERLAAERKDLTRKLRSELEAFIQRVQRELHSEQERVRKEVREGRGARAIEQARARLLRDTPKFEVASPSADASFNPQPGDLVRHRRLGWEGAVQARHGSRVELAVSGKRVELELDELELKVGRDALKPNQAGQEADPADELPAELHLRGQRVEDALIEMDTFLDRAFRRGLKQVRIVHGHGTGRLRQAVRNHLGHHPLVGSFRPGEPHEGGNGATVVLLSCEQRGSRRA